MGQKPDGIHHSRRKFLLELLDRHIRILHGIVEQRHTGRKLVVHAFRQMDGMKDVGHTALVKLPVVGIVGQNHGLHGQFCIDHL